MIARIAICARCPQRATCRKIRQHDATCEHWPADLPALPTLAVRAMRETAQWLVKGAPLAPPDIRDRRLAICQQCPHWDPAAVLGTGRCKHPGCGCTKAKHLYATSRCPMGQWLPSDTASQT